MKGSEKLMKKKDLLHIFLHIRTKKKGGGKKNFLILKDPEGQGFPTCEWRPKIMEKIPVSQVGRQRVRVKRLMLKNSEINIACVL